MWSASSGLSRQDAEATSNVVVSAGYNSLEVSGHEIVPGIDGRSVTIQL